MTDSDIRLIAEHYGFNALTAKLADQCAQYAASVHCNNLYGYLEKKHSEAKGFFHKKGELSAIYAQQQLASVIVFARTIEYLMTIYPELKEKLDDRIDKQCYVELKNIEEELDASSE